MPRFVKILLAVICGLLAWFAVATVGNLVLRAAISGYAQVEPTFQFTLPMLVAQFPLWYHLFFLMSLMPFVLLGGKLGRTTSF